MSQASEKRRRELLVALSIDGIGRLWFLWSRQWLTTAASVKCG